MPVLVPSIGPDGTVTYWRKPTPDRMGIDPWREYVDGPNGLMVPKENDVDRLRRFIPMGWVHTSYSSLTLQQPLLFGPRRETPPWPTTTSDRAEPIKAWKSAGLRWDPKQRRLRLASTGAGVDMYEVEAEAVHHDPYWHGTDCPVWDDDDDDVVCECTPPEPHSAPDPTGQCRSCGFYAVAERPMASGGFLLEVELYGRVIRHAKGYRAQYQRVLAVHVPPFCESCVPHQRAVGLSWDDNYLQPYCLKHRPFGRVSLGEVAQYLGCELRWDVGQARNDT